MSHANTEEQDAILAVAKASRSNLMISALAGTGKTSPMTSLPTSSIPSFSVASSNPTKGSLTTTIRYTCPRCSVVHTLSFHLFSLTNTKTCHQSITPFLESLFGVGLSELGTLGRTSTDSVALPQGGLKKRKRRTPAKDCL